jgi:hypothetical protein
MQIAYQEAVELSTLWESYFPTETIPVEYWRLLLDKYPPLCVTHAIKRCVKKHIALKGKITLEQMQAYMESSCHKKTQVPRNLKIAENGDV